MSSPSLMASFGHSGSQAPQLMHSSVIVVAIGRSLLRLETGATLRNRAAKSITCARRIVKRAAPLDRGDAAPTDAAAQGRARAGHPAGEGRHGVLGPGDEHRHAVAHELAP